MSIFIVLLVLIINVIDSQLVPPQTYLWNPQDLVSVKQKVINKDPDLVPIVQLLDSKAKQYMQQGPWSVTYKKYIPPSGDKHDYMSLDKYYWPCNVIPHQPEGAILKGVLADCNTTTGLPYVQHDGYSNPEEHLYDHDGLVNMTFAVTGLGTAYYFTDNEDYVKKAVELLQVFFINNDTKMNPNLDFGHFIPGVANGTHGGVIDLHPFPEMLDAIALMRLSSNWPKTLDTGLKNWLKDYLHWLRNSTLGKEEMDTNNNHGVWYDVQCGFISLHINSSISDKIAQDAIGKRINKQILANGELPFEEFRTKSWSYSEFCLDAYFHLATFSTWTSTDLFHAVNSRIRLSLDYQLQYVEGNAQWPFPQIVPFLQNCSITTENQCIGSYFNILRMAANEYKSSTYENQICKLPGIDCKINILNLLYEKKE